MSSITIRDLENELTTAIRAKVRADGTSLNQTIQRLLEGALGIRPSTSVHRKDFEKFCSMWTRAQFADFEKAAGHLGRVDP